MESVIQEQKIRTLIQEELSFILPELEVVEHLNLTDKEKELCNKAEEEYINNETSSFEEVYKNITK